MNNRLVIFLILSISFAFPNFNKITYNIKKEQSVYNNKDDILLIQNSKNNFEKNTTIVKDNSKPSPTKYTYKDGKYNATVQSFKPGLKLEVTVKKDKIVDIKVLSHYDSKLRMNYAKSKLIKQIIDENSLDVDTISTATYSSKGIIRGVKACLEKAKNN